MKRSTLLAGVALVLATVFTQSAGAQEAPSIALNQYQHPEAGDAFLSVPAPWVGGHLVPRGMITFDYAKDPLVLVDQDDNVVGNPVTAQAYLHVGASFALWDRLLVGVSMPIAVLQDGDDPGAGAPQFASASGAAPGDLRAGLRGRILGEYYDPFQLGVSGWVFFPTGDDAAYTGEGSVYGLPMLNIGGRLPYFVYSAALGAYVRGSDNPSQFYYSAGAGVLLLDDTLQIGPELFGAVAFEDKALNAGGAAIDRKGSVNGELLGSVRYRFIDDFVLGAGAGSGIANGVGTPQLRVLAQFAYSPEPEREKEGPGDRDKDGILDPDDACPDTPGVKDPDPKKNGCPPDSDGDGILDKDDACPTVPGVPNEDPEKHGCPPPGDRDGDGILDPDDACIDEPGIPSDDPAKHGCPPPPSDRDGDGIIDDVDACPDVPGVKSDDPKKNGCPPDSDGDGILDPDDACPDKPGMPNKDPKKHGCPRVVVTEKEVLILQKVEFEFDKAKIRPESDSLLDEVAQTLKDHPELVLLEVQGHTDNKGGAFYNKALSDKRAKAVRQALIERGIDANRLTAKGYGMEKPIASNDTEDGRATNRRVQFSITKRDDSKKKPKP